MKKSKNVAGVGKKTAETSTPSIHKFFKSTTKALPDDKGASKVVTYDATHAVYVELLKAKLHDENADSNGAELDVIQNDTVTVSADVIEEQVPESGVEATKNVGADTNVECLPCKRWEVKYKDLKKDYMKMGTNYAELRIKYDDLLLTKTYIDAEQLSASKQTTNQSDTEVFKNNGIFTSSEIEVLRNMQLEAKNDSTFILSCLKFAYKNDLSLLRTITLKGTAEAMVVDVSGEVTHVPGKNAMSPPKIKMIRELFVERIAKCKLKPAAYAVRIKDGYMNKLIASGITNLAKK